MKTFKHKAMGFIAGVIVTATAVTAVAAPTMLNARWEQDVKIFVDGVRKYLPDDQVILNWDNRNHVPIRYFSNAIGAQVDWIEEKKEIRITTPEPVIVEKEVIKEVIKEVPTYKDTNYYKMPLAYEQNGLGFSLNQVGLGRNAIVRIEVYKNERYMTFADYNKIYVELPGGDKIYPLSYNTVGWENSLFVGFVGELTFEEIPLNTDKLTVYVPVRYYQDSYSRDKEITDTFSFNVQIKN